MIFPYKIIGLDENGYYRHPSCIDSKLEIVGLQKRELYPYQYGFYLTNVFSNTDQLRNGDIVKIWQATDLFRSGPLYLGMSGEVCLLDDLLTISPPYRSFKVGALSKDGIFHVNFQDYGTKR